MDEEKAAAYYDELTRKGEGAARFKQGLGFSNSTSNDDVPKPGSALPSSSSFFSKFVKASDPSNSKASESESEKQAQLQSIQNKLKKEPTSESRVSRERDSDGSRSRDRYRDRERERRKDSRRRSRSRSRDRDRDRYRHRERRRRISRSRSRSDSDGDGRNRGRERARRRSRSVSPRRSDKNSSETGQGKNAGLDYANLIQGYRNMSSAERVKAKMKLQLSETAARDSKKGAGWERFEFNKDAPLDDEEIEVAEDDATLVKHIGQSFRFSAVKAKWEDQIQAAHEEAMFGASAVPPSISTDSEPEKQSENEDDKRDPVTSLLNETVLAKQKGSWRDRVRGP